jgi:hypothetical protein
MAQLRERTAFSDKADVIYQGQLERLERFYELAGKYRYDAPDEHRDTFDADFRALTEMEG